MDEAFRKLLGQRGSMASSSTVLERVRKLYGPVSASDIATGMRQQELERVHQQYGNLSTEAASRAMSAFGDVDQFKFMFNTFPVQTEKSILKISVGEKISDLMHTAFEGHNTAILAEQSQRNQVAALNDVSVRYGAVCASLLAFFAAESQACRMDLSQVAKEAGLRHLGLMASADTALGHNIIANFFRVAQASEIGSLAKHATSRDRLSAVAFADSFALESLTSRMGAMEMPWVSISDSVRSVAAFAHVQAIGDIVHSAPPFDLEVAGWLRADLGDWRDQITVLPDDLLEPELRTELYVDRGFNRTLTEFTPHAFHQSVSIARLTEVEWVEVEDWCPATSDELLRQKSASDRLQLFEMAMRRFIAMVMTGPFGDDWMDHRLPNGILDSWKQKQQSDLKTGAEVQPLIDYANFADYQRIIKLKLNWSTVFKQYFGRPEDIRESLQRLYPVRLATMHARIITQDDILLLMVETKRVVKSFKRS